MQIFLETDRLVLRRFTEADVDNLFDLDSDPEVMRFINGGKPTPRDVIENDILPRFLQYYERFAGYGFWATIEKSTGRFWAGSTSGHRRAAVPTTSSLATGRVMEKSGLRLVRTFHQPWPEHIDAAEHGDVEYALSRAD